MATIGNLVVNLTANTNRFSKNINRSRAMVQSFATSAIGKFAAVGTAAAAIGTAVVGFKKLISAGNEFDRKMTNSLAIMGNVSKRMRGEMVQAAFDVASATKFSGAEASEAFFFLASAGLDATASVAAMPKVAKFAQAGNFDLALATDLLTDAQSALGLSSKDAAENMKSMTRVSDVLVKANTLANASVQQFSEALTNKAGAALRGLGKDVEEGVAVLAAFADQGVKGSEAGTQFAIVLRDLQTKAIQNEDAFAAMGVRVFDAIGDMRNMSDVVGDLEKTLDGLGDKQRKTTLLNLGFSDKSVSALQTLLGTSGKIRQYEMELQKAKGTTEEIADKQLTKFDKGLNKLSASAEKLGAALSNAFSGTFGTVMSVASEGVGVFTEMVNESKAALDEVIASMLKLAQVSDEVPRTQFVDPNPKGGESATSGARGRIMLDRINRREGKLKAEQEAPAKALQDQAGKLKESLKSPMDKLNEHMLKLFDLQEAGLINYDELKASADNFKSKLDPFIEGARLEEESLTKREKLNRELAKIEDLKNKGALSITAAERLTKSRQKEFEDAMNPQRDTRGQSLTSLQKGSAAAFQAIQRAQRGSRDSRERQMAKDQKNTAKNTADTAKAVREVAAAIRDENVVESFA